MLFFQVLLLSLGYISDAAAASASASLNLTPVKAANLIRLRRSNRDLQTSSHALRAAHISNVTALRSTGSSFLAQLTIESSTFFHVVDTGSSDTWVAASNFTCVTIGSNKPRSQDQCRFGNTYTSGSSFQAIANENFNVTYGDGEYLTGTFGRVPVTFAGVRVPNQQVAIATLAAWQGDQQSSGVIGLSYSALTDAYAGTDPRQDRYCSYGATPQNSRCNQIEYSSIIDNIFFRDNLTAPQFSLALSRDESGIGNGGYWSIGGLPPLDAVGVKDQSFASTPMKILPGDDRFRYYLIGIDGLVILTAGTALPPEKRSAFQIDAGEKETRDVDGDEDTEKDGDRNARPRHWGGGHRGYRGHHRSTLRRPTSTMTWRNSSITRTTPSSTTSITSGSNSISTPSNFAVVPGSKADYVLDSGTTLSFIPSAMAKKFNSMFNPPATVDPSTGFYLVPCSAKVPPLGVKIGGMVFFHNPIDLVKPYNDPQCLSGIQDSNRIGGINVLGDVFLDNVLAVFNLTRGDNRVWFAARRDYSS